MTKPYEPSITEVFTRLLEEANRTDQDTVTVSTFELAAVTYYLDKQQAHLESAYKRLNRHAVAPLRLKYPETDGTDYVLEGPSCWLEINGVKLYLRKTASRGVVVEVYPNTDNLGQPLAELYVPAPENT